METAGSTFNGRLWNECLNRHWFGSEDGDREMAGGDNERRSYISLPNYSALLKVALDRMSRPQMGACP
ncbi:protein of unknown function [Candidatus Bipolaricaulis anaerobius]|uniref:Uncharacterized protein n=1 Tax=Candidatus Bipolaricaulis anaerobius TaxID=2026885 RepID=A0A2X3KX34_9BACT|nr:protein of unknown function [Candidatus Bipolaricaulis anaerobius]